MAEAFKTNLCVAMPNAVHFFTLNSSGVYPTILHTKMIDPESTVDHYVTGTLYPTTKLQRVYFCLHGMSEEKQRDELILKKGYERGCHKGDISSQDNEDIETVIYHSHFLKSTAQNLAMPTVIYRNNTQAVLTNTTKPVNDVLAGQIYVGLPLYSQQVLLQLNSKQDVY